MHGFCCLESNSSNAIPNYTYSACIQNIYIGQLVIENRNHSHPHYNTSCPLWETPGEERIFVHAWSIRGNHLCRHPAFIVCKRGTWSCEPPPGILHLHEGKNISGRSGESKVERKATPSRSPDTKSFRFHLSCVLSSVELINAWKWARNVRIRSCSFFIISHSYVTFWT